MDTLTTLYSVVAAGLIVPLVEYGKKKLPGDFPIQPPVYAAILSIGVAILMARFFDPTMTLEAAVQMALSTQVLSQFFHAAVKTKTETML